jgi:hypothetical protein
MRQKKIKRVRRIAKMLAKTQETTYNDYKPPVHWQGKETIKIEGKWIYPGSIIEPGIPRVMKNDCVKSITKRILADG